MSLLVVFPGQGSQSVGMLSDMADNSVVRATFDEASEALGFDLWNLVQNGPAEELNKTENTQPALLTASIALWRAWNDQGGAKPCALSGHSLGEYSALVAAGAMGFSDAVKLVRLRGQLMQDAVPSGTGGMAAVIGMEDEAVQGLCDAVMAALPAETISPANYNAPGQVVIAGSAAAVSHAASIGKEHGARMVKPLAVSVPSHCQLMKPAAEKFAIELANIQLNAPQIPVIHNVDGAAAVTAEEISQKLVSQLHQPVRWVACIHKMAEEGEARCIEMGPGNVLTGLNKRIIKAADLPLSCANVNNAESLTAALGENA